MVMTKATPYNQRPEWERTRERTCLREVLAGAAAPRAVYDAFGGIGMAGLLAQEFWPEARLHAWELDGACAEEYRRAVPGAEVHHGNTMGAIADLAVRGIQPDAAILDFNRLTIMDLESADRDGDFRRWIVEIVVGWQPKWIELTDSAVGKLHLNWKNYNVPSPSWEDYVGALDLKIRSLYGYRIAARSRHHSASYFRLEK